MRTRGQWLVWVASAAALGCSALNPAFDLDSGKEAAGSNGASTGPGVGGSDDRPGVTSGMFTSGRTDDGMDTLADGPGQTSGPQSTGGNPLFDLGDGGDEVARVVQGSAVVADTAFGLVGNDADGFTLPWQVHALVLRIEPAATDGAQIVLFDSAGESPANSQTNAVDGGTEVIVEVQGASPRALCLRIRDAALDGEWQGSFPSGDGAPGGDFAFPVYWLLGDVTGDGTVDELDDDAASVAQDLGIYIPRADVNGDGEVDSMDREIIGTENGANLKPSDVPAPCDFR